MINNIISQLQSKGIKVEKTKSRYDVFQAVFDRHSSGHLNSYAETAHPDKRSLMPTHSFPDI
ncbi:Lmo0850 family protein [Bacillus sp. 1P06AnD]|uniref:Lmo0850 family protein n=1 Tax=Bacillus sp. 1P06AnD TaxID=3132208 RepID=UPI0039A14BF9